MDKDFHYYGTYVAACYAGYSAKEAQIIAHAAQYVDDSSHGLFPIETNRLINKGDYEIDFQPIPTCHTLKELGWNIVTPKGWISPSSLDLRKVWVPFHFLPGNYKSHTLPDPDVSSRIKNYAGPVSWFSSTWEYDDHAKLEFKLLCLPDSPISLAMINDIIDKHKGQSYELHLIGLRMHVLADTAAHSYYAGTPAWHVNDVDSDVYYFTDNSEWEKVSFGVASEWCAPKALTFESDFYLGHGRVGHIPDYPWIKYRYIPKWREEAGKDEKEIMTDNPASYLKIFKEMVTALKCIRNQKTFDINSLEPIDQKYIDVIDKILRKNHGFCLSDSGVNFRCQLWKDAISNGSLDPLVSMPEEYNEDVWLNIVKQKGSVTNTDYYEFNKAATIHLEFVKSCLAGDGINLYDYIS